MKTSFLLALVLAFASVNAFSFATFNAQENSEAILKLEEKIQSAKEASEIKYINGVFLEGNFNKADLNNKGTITLKQGILDITFMLEKGNIVYKAVKTDKFDTLEFNMETEKVNGESRDPHAAVDVSAVVTAVKNGKNIQTGKVKVVTVEAIFLSSGVPSQPITNTAVPTADGKCARCGSSDPYHCGTANNGPCSAKEAPKAPKAIKQVITEVKQHKPDCVDKYHCDCPTVKKTVNVPLVKSEVKVHNADCVDKYHCDCPTKTVYR